MEGNYERNPLKTKDTFLAIMDWLAPQKVLEFRRVCKDWARWVDAAPWSWEAQEPLQTAKRARIEFGYPLLGEKYSMLYQLGETRRPGKCTFVCVRDIDQALEIKDVTININEVSKANLRKVLTGAPGKVTAIRHLNNKRFAIGYDTGHVLIWSLETLELLFTIPAFKNSITQVCNVYVNKKRIDRTGASRTIEEDLLVAADISGQLTCWELHHADRIPKLRWTIPSDKASPCPIKEIHAKVDGFVDVILCDDINNKFILKTFSCEDHTEIGEPKEISKPFAPLRKATLKRLKVFRNGNVLDLAIWNDDCNQSVGVRTYVWDLKTSTYNTVAGFFSADLLSGNGSWLFCQAYALEDSFAYVSLFKKSGKECEAQIAFPRRLPNTRWSLNIEKDDKEVADTPKNC